MILSPPYTCQHPWLILSISSGTMTNLFPTIVFNMCCRMARAKLVINLREGPRKLF